MNKNKIHRDLSQQIPSEIIQTLVKRWGVDKNVRKLSTEKLVSILIGGLVYRLDSLRELEKVFGTPKSTLADALTRRSAGFFEDLCHEISKYFCERCESRKERKNARALIAFDSTECRVHSSLLRFKAWKKSRNKTSSFKLHVFWNLESEWIEDFRTTPGCSSDVTTAHKMEFSRGKIYVGDRAYFDMALWMRIIKSGSDFVTRIKSTTRLRSIHKQNLDA